MHLTRSDLVPERISSLLPKDGGYRKVSWLKNSSIFPPRICVDIYICENSRTCVLSYCFSWPTLRIWRLECWKFILLNQVIQSDAFAEYSRFSELSMLFSSNFFNYFSLWIHYYLSSRLLFQVKQVPLIRLVQKGFQFD